MGQTSSWCMRGWLTCLSPLIAPRTYKILCAIGQLQIHANTNFSGIVRKHYFFLILHIRLNQYNYSIGLLQIHRKRSDGLDLQLVYEGLQGFILLTYLQQCFNTVVYYILYLIIIRPNGIKRQKIHGCSFPRGNRFVGVRFHCGFNKAADKNSRKSQFIK